MPDLVGGDHVRGLTSGLNQLRSVSSDLRKKNAESAALDEFDTELNGLEKDIGKIEPGTDELKGKPYLKAYNRLLAAIKAAKALKREVAAEGETVVEWEVKYEAKESLFDSAAKKIIDEARTKGPTYGTPGPKDLGKHARHHHVGNDYGVAFEFDIKKKQLLVLGYGKKHNRGKGKGDSSYDWQT